SIVMYDPDFDWLFLDFNSRPLYRGRPKHQEFHQLQLRISTHAPYTEGDKVKSCTCHGVIISTHAPYTEGDGKKQAI
uniref:hypothetical protein n=1 Tax=Ligilactobacillus ruminis TaxID=1623 RepID=UPI0019D3B749